MEFKEATDVLGNCPSQDALAAACGVSRASIKAARLDPSSAGHRPPPDGWPEAVARLARARAAELNRLAEAMEDV